MYCRCVPFFNRPYVSVEPGINIINNLTIPITAYWLINLPQTQWEDKRQLLPGQKYSSGIISIEHPVEIQTIVGFYLFDEGSDTPHTDCFIELGDKATGTFTASDIRSQGQCAIGSDIIY